MSAARFSSSLARRIVFLNLGALGVLLAGILVLNEFRAGLIDAEVDSLYTQGRIIAGAIAASATVDTNAISVDPERLLQLQAGERLTPQIDESLTTFPINPEEIAPLLRYLVLPTGNRAQIFGPESDLILDSARLIEPRRILGQDLPPPGRPGLKLVRQLWNDVVLWFGRGELALYRDTDDGRAYPEVTAALSGNPGNTVRISARGAMIVSVAVPIKRLKIVHGALLLSTQGGDIDAILFAERMAILRVFLVAALVTLVLSVLLAGTIAGPVKRLAAAAERVRHSVKAREELPQMDERQDEIGHLARALRDMTAALYNRLDANERFAADVAHEIKNPLTSLRSAVETLPATRSEDERNALLEIIGHDVRRLDRLISDISDASRLDAELAKADASPVDMAALLRMVIGLAQNARRNGVAALDLNIEPAAQETEYFVLGHASRLGQIVENLVNNALSFSQPGGAVQVALHRVGADVVIFVDDAGPGIQEGARERLFERFYTDRPEGENFGDHSGLGLSISRQIADAHHGTITAENRYEADLRQSRGPDNGGHEGKICGARFVLRLPAIADAG